MNSTIQSDTHSSWPHRLAVVLVCATFPLIWVGGLVTTYDAGMSVPDWPATYGYNLFLYPVSTWLSAPWDLFIEHGHRLLASGVGLLTIAFVAVVWMKEDRRWVRWWSVLCLLLVIMQGVLGGTRVLFDEILLARLHGCLGPAFFASCVVAASVTSKWWREATLIDGADARSFRRLTVVLLGMSYLQLVLGAHLRHLPAGWAPSTFLTLVSAHLLVAVALLIYSWLAAIACFRSQRLRSTRLLATPSFILAALVVLQIGVGVATWSVKYAWPRWLPGGGFFDTYTVQAESMLQATTVTGHVAIGSLILALATMVAVRSSRLCSASLQTAVIAGSRQMWECAT